MISPYKRVRTSYLATQLNIAHADVEQLLVTLILDERIRGRIDQVPWSRFPTWLIVWNAAPCLLLRCDSCRPCDGGSSYW